MFAPSNKSFFSDLSLILHQLSTSFYFWRNKVKKIVFVQCQQRMKSYLFSIRGAKEDLFKVGNFKCGEWKLKEKNRVAQKLNTTHNIPSQILSAAKSSKKTKKEKLILTSMFFHFLTSFYIYTKFFIYEKIWCPN